MRLAQFGMLHSLKILSFHLFEGSDIVSLISFFFQLLVKLCLRLLAIQFVLREQHLAQNIPSLSHKVLPSHVFCFGFDVTSLLDRHLAFRV
jgi:hypothetical protein